MCDSRAFSPAEGARSGRGRHLATLLGALLVVLGLPGVGVAQEPPAPAPAAAAPVPAPALSEDELHDRLRQLRAAMETALNQGDLEGILARIEPNVVFTTMNGDVVQGRDGVKAYFAKMMTGPNKVVEKISAKFEPTALSILYGGDTAIAWGTTDDHYQLANGQELAVKALWSSTMVLRDGQWSVANFHYSTNMFDNPVLQAQRKLLTGIVVAGALVGAVLGFLIGRRRRA